MAAVSQNADAAVKITEEENKNGSLGILGGKGKGY